MVVTRLVASQRQAGHDVQLVFEDPCQELVPLPPGLTEDDLLMVPAPRVQDRLRDVPFQETVAAAFHEADLIHVHGIWGRVPYRAMRLACTIGKPYVISPHGMLNTWALQQKPLRKKAALLAGVKQQVHAAQGVHALSEYEHDCVKSWGFQSSVVTIPNGVDLDDIDPLPPAGTFRQQYPQLNADGIQKPFVLFLSRLHPGKRLDLLAEAFAKIAEDFPELRLVVVGPDAGARQDFELRIDQLGCRDKVVIPGPLWGRDKFAAMVDAYCFCLPSDHESFSVAIVEALACSCPVVISEQCHFAQVAEVNAGLLTRLDSNHLADQLSKLICDPESTDKMRGNARRFVESEFQWAHLAQRLLQFYEATLQGNAVTV